ncbi:MAG TPA: glycosyltransferase [Gemmatimonadaceae bacterium]|nr:glycosyltransferase [Gemmatimonadaceae bacterium]
MRVLFLTHSYPRQPGDAAGSFLLHLASALKDEGVFVSVVAPAADHLPADEVFDGIPVHRFRYAPRRYQRLAYTGTMAEEVRRSFSAKLALVGFLGSEFARGTSVRREFAPDLVHAHWWFPGGLVGSWVAAMAHLPLVITMHGSDVRLAHASSVGRPLMRHVLAQSRAVTTVSNWLADRVRDVVPGAAPVVSPMPVATSLFTPGDSRHAARFLFVGRLNEQKGVELLLDALARMRAPAELDIVGDGDAREALRGRAGALGIADRVTWHAPVPQPRLVDFYRRATALVVPSVGEGLGLVAVEAQLCETPVIAFDSGGLSDTIQDGATGYLVPPGDVDALAARMDFLLGDAARDGIARAARQAALARFAPESVARRYAQLYRSVLAAREA